MTERIARMGEGQTRLWSGLLLALCLIWVPAAGMADDPARQIERIGKRLGIDGQLAVRIIAMGLENQRSDRPEDAREIVCFYDQPTGSHITHVLCATNRSLGAGPGNVPFSLFGSSNGNASPMIGAPDAGGFLIAMPANPRRMERLIDSLGGLPGMNERLVQMGLAGLEIPDDLPTADELDRYAEALVEVEAIGDRYDARLSEADGEARARLRRESEHRMEVVIRRAGLRLERYNRITELVTQHPELFEYVRERLDR